MTVDVPGHKKAGPAHSVHVGHHAFHRSSSHRRVTSEGSWVESPWTWSGEGSESERHIPRGLGESTPTLHKCANARSGGRRVRQPESRTMNFWSRSFAFSRRAWC